MKLCITEKPSVAKDIASIIGATTRRDGYYEGNGYKVTWTYGHLCSLKEPADYTELWKHWSLGALPMIPQKFGIKIIEQDSIKKQFNIIKTLIEEASEVINCGDAGQEGELIQRWVMQKAECNCSVSRLWISSLTDESIKEGFQKLYPQTQFDNLYFAGLSRAIGDWVLGMNATRLYSLKYSSPGNVLSIGRVQTPTLALIVQRHHEIMNFIPEDFWEIKTTYKDVVFNAISDRFKSVDAANVILDKIGCGLFVVKEIIEKKGKESPLRLFDLTSLQVECNKKWGWTADDTLKLIQSLYEKKVTTYPRVDTTYLSEDLYDKIPEILSKMSPYAYLTSQLLSDKIHKSKKVFDNKKVTDHHAIIPTGVLPTSLVGDEKKMYHLIALRFIAAFYPDCEFLSTTVFGEVEDVRFKATGKVIETMGWRSVFELDRSIIDDEEDKLLPHFDIGESGPHTPSLLKKTTQPPKYYTEGTLLRAMETAGKMVEEEELRDAMKENGIGRPSTRAAIIETLFKRKYIYRERKNIMASKAGIELIATINDELLKSAKLTGLWENKLRRIEKGEYSAKDFVNELKQLVQELVISVLKDNSSKKIDVESSGKTNIKGKQAKQRITKYEQIKCPKCGIGYILKGKTAFGCSEYKNGCDLKLLFEQYPDTLTPSKLNKLI